MANPFKAFFMKLFSGLFRKKKHVKLGLYGPPNGGKTTLANRICQDWLGGDMGGGSNIAHETREIQIKEQISIKNEGGKELTFNLVDTPGIATKIDYEDFIKAGLAEKEAKVRAKEATKGIIDSIRRRSGPMKAWGSDGGPRPRSVSLLATQAWMAGGSPGKDRVLPTDCRKQSSKNG